MIAEDAVVPDELLTEFLWRGAQSLDALLPLPCPAASLMEIRQRLLQTQSTCLQSIVNHYNKKNEERSLELTADQVQAALHRCCSGRDETRNNNLRWIDMEHSLNEAARLAFARLVLYSECLWELQEEPVRRARDNGFRKSGELSDDDVQTFCGLCRAAVQLPNVQEYLGHEGRAIFTALPHPSVDQQKRLDYIQRLFMKAIGYDPDFAMRAIQIKFFRDNNGTNDNDNNLKAIVRATLATMDAALSEATDRSTHATIFAEPVSSSDDGVTKVVAVHYSEKFIDAETGEELLITTNNNRTLNDGASPRVETMVDAEREPQQSSMENPTAATSTATSDTHRQHELRLAQQASELQQEILGELLNLSDEERKAKLALAREASETLHQQLFTLPPGPERVAFLTSVDPTTQRLLAMYKLWEGVLAAHGGEPPQMRSSGAVRRSSASEY